MGVRTEVNTEGHASEVANESTIGLYQNGHQTDTIFVSNPGDSHFSLGNCNQTCFAVFTFGSGDPIELDPPLLDGGRFFSDPGTGGNSSAMSGPPPTDTDSTLVPGRQVEVQAVDSPSMFYFDFHPAYLSSQVTSVQLGLTFTTYLTVWSNISGVTGPSGDWADRVYGALLAQPWTISATYQVDANFNGTPVGIPTANMPNWTDFSGVKPFNQQGIIMTPPTVNHAVAVSADK